MTESFKRRVPGPSRRATFGHTEKGPQTKSPGSPNKNKNLDRRRGACLLFWSQWIGMPFGPGDCGNPRVCCCWGRTHRPRVRYNKRDRTPPHAPPTHPFRGLCRPPHRGGAVSHDSGDGVSTRGPASPGSRVGEVLPPRGPICPMIFRLSGLAPTPSPRLCVGCPGYSSYGAVGNITLVVATRPVPGMGCAGRTK